MYKKTEIAISESKWKLHNWGDSWLVSRWRFNEGITEYKLNKSWVFSHKICGPELKVSYGKRKLEEIIQATENQVADVFYIDRVVFEEQKPQYCC